MTTSRTMSYTSPLRVPMLAALAAALGMAAAGITAASAGTAAPLRADSAGYPKSGVLLWTRLTARAAPSSSARAVKVFSQFRRDFRPTVLLAVGERRDAKGLLWLKVSLPMRPNGRSGWVKAVAVQVRPVTRRIVIDRSARTLSLYDRGRLRFRTRVAIGKPGAETPLGRFYIQASFRPKERFFGAHALETSAYSKLSDWPGGGVVGIHGTPYPQLLGKAVSHGCVRVSNRAALVLKRLAPPGTPVAVTR